MSEKLVNITEAARLLGLSTDTLRKWDNSGKLMYDWKGANNYSGHKRTGWW